MEKIMTLDEVSEYLLIPKPTLYRLLKQGKVPAFKVGNKWRFSAELIDRWLWSQIPSGKNFLIIDDEALICFNLEKIFSSEGHYSTSVHNGEDAIKEIEKKSYDIIFLDLALPDINGVQVLKRIKEIKPDQLVVIITGYPDSDLLNQALELSPLAFVKKPFRREQIRNLIQSIFKLPISKDKN